MVRKFIKHIASKLSPRLQILLKRFYFAYQIRNKNFRTNEKEYNHLTQWISEGDWVLDIGANIGHYTARFSEIVGIDGRVIAFEPVPNTFELLSANMATAGCKNVTLLNVAVSDKTKIMGIEMPKFDTGLDNYYRATLTNNSDFLQVLCLSVNDLNLSNSIKLIKIDAEGHDLIALQGMRDILERDWPILIVEDDSTGVLEYLDNLGYKHKRIENSHNLVFTKN